MRDEEPEVESSEAEAAPDKRGPPLIVMIGGGVVLLIVVVAIAGFVLFGKNRSAPEAKTKTDSTATAMEFGHVDNADENAQRAAALARQAADGEAPKPANSAEAARP